VMAAGVDSEDACKISHGESAAGFQDLNKKALYQKEQRVDPPTTKEVDYNELKLLEDKLARIRIKARLYENKRDSDYQQVQQLSSSLHNVIEEKEYFKKVILKLQNDLKEMQQRIDCEANNIRSDVDSVI
jgi:hypothetical protein